MSNGKAEPTNQRQVGREIVVRREGLEVLRLDVPAGGGVPDESRASGSALSAVWQREVVGTNPASCLVWHDP